MMMMMIMNAADRDPFSDAKSELMQGDKRRAETVFAFVTARSSVKILLKETSNAFDRG